MPTTFRPYEPNQTLLLPPDLRDWLPPDHLAYDMADLVDTLDLAPFYAPYEGDGRRNCPYEPAMMVKTLLYAYATGTFSSRTMARKLEADVAFRVLAAGNFPRHRTLCEFRRRHLADVAHLFREVVHLARELGLVELGALAIDGSKLRANASKRKAMSYGRMLREEQRLRIEIDALLAQAEAVDAAEDDRFGPDRSGFERSGEWQRRNDRLAAIRAAKARLEAKQRQADDDRGRRPGQERNPRGGQPYTRSYGAPDPKAQANVTDPESSIMKTSTDGFQQCYNAQIAVDGTQQLIVAADLSAHPSDQGQLHAVLDQVEAHVKQRPPTVLADAGYCNEHDLARLERKGIEGYVAVGRDGRRAAGARPRPATARMAAKLATGDGKARYATRKWMAEAPDGWIKRVLGFRQFSLRGQWPAAREWDLVCTATNIRRLRARRTA